MTREARENPVLSEIARHGRLDRLCPRVTVDVLVLHHRTRHLHKDEVQSLSYSVLLRRVRYGCLIRDAPVRLEVIALVPDVLAPAVRAQRDKLVANLN